MRWTLPILATLRMAICADFFFWKQMTGTFAEVMKGLVMALGAVYLFLSVYFYPLLDRMDTGFWVTLRNAGLLAFKYLPRTLYMVLWIGIVWIARKIAGSQAFADTTSGRFRTCVFSFHGASENFCQEGSEAICKPYAAVFQTSWVYLLFFCCPYIIWE